MLPTEPTTNPALTVTPWSVIEKEYRRLRVPSLDKRARAEQAEIRREVVALYQRYEGHVTDGAGSDVRVTGSSFARRMGLRRQTLQDWIRGAGTCVNTGVPRREGFVRPINKKLREAIRVMDHISQDTRNLIAEDLLETKGLVDRLLHLCQGEST